MRRTLSRLLIFLGWSLYATALLCPAMAHACGDWSGARCLVATLCAFPFWLMWPVMTFGIANLALLASPFVYCSQGGPECRAYGVFLFLCTLASLQALWWDPLVGCYLWILSLFATATGFLLAVDTERTEKTPV